MGCFQKSFNTKVIWFTHQNVHLLSYLQRFNVSLVNCVTNIYSIINIIIIHVHHKLHVSPNHFIYKIIQISNFSSEIAKSYVWNYSLLNLHKKKLQKSQSFSLIMMKNSIINIVLICKMKLPERSLLFRVIMKFKNVLRVWNITYILYLLFYLKR